MTARFLSYLETRSWRAEELRAGGYDRTRCTLLEPLTFVSAVHGEITAPAGMVTDLASIPRLAFAYLAPDDPAIEYASVIHDHLYDVAGYVRPGLRLTRQQCDDVLREAMLACGARPAQAWVVYAAVRLGGGGHWRDPLSPT